MKGCSIPQTADEREKIYAHAPREKEWSGEQKILNFKGTVVKGWTGLYEAKLSGPFFRLAYDAGSVRRTRKGSGW